jgi:hypothetical protein
MAAASSGAPITVDSTLFLISRLPVEFGFFSRELQDAWQHASYAGETRALAAGIITTYLTSIWLWLVVIGAPIARFLLWSRTRGATLLGQLFDTQQRPFTALGFVVFVLFLIAGGVVTLVSAV